MIPKCDFPTHLANAEFVEIEPIENFEIPLLGRVTAGEPIEAIETHETVSVPAHMVKKNTYALQVRGDSMIDANIQDGDIIVVEKRETAENGQSAVVLIHGEKVTLKKFYIEDDGVRLQPANDSMQPIYLQPDEVQILGIVQGIIREEV